MNPLKEMFVKKISKKIVAVSMLMLMGTQAFAAGSPSYPYILAEEHMFKEKKATTDLVYITKDNNIITQGNVFQIAFDCKLWSEKAKAGERVNFVAPEAIYTQEGTLLIPANSKVVATIIKIEKPK